MVAAVLHGTFAWFGLRAPSPVVASRYVDLGTDDLLWLDEPALGASLESAGPVAPSTADDGPLGATSGKSSGRAVAALSRASPSHAASPLPGESTVGPEAAPLAPSSAIVREPGGNGPELSLDQLGIGKNPFVANLARDPLERPRRSSEGFRRSMADSIVRREQSLGLGADGPILKVLEQEVRQSETTPNSRARFRATIDRRGNLVAFELLEATSDHRPWRALAERVLAALRKTKLRVPKTGRGQSLDLYLESRAQLPSGADPGTAIDILGIPVKKGGGPRSHRMAILSLDPFVLFSLGFDFVDIGASTQRVVRSHVERVSSEDVADLEPLADDGSH